jgi:hypothetical protein
MSNLNILQKRTILVLERMIQLCKDSEYYAEDFSKFLETELEDMRCSDAFGTEGSTDPRGDFRNGEFSMNHVEGIDD